MKRGRDKMAGLPANKIRGRMDMRPKGFGRLRNHGALKIREAVAREEERRATRLRRDVP